MKHLVLQDHLPADLRAVVHDDVHVCPCAKLPLPVGDGGQGSDDEEGASDPHVEDLVQEGDGLDGLSQTHFICQYAVFPAQKDKGVRHMSCHDLYSKLCMYVCLCAYLPVVPVEQ